jgi:hypothetical protein
MTQSVSEPDKERLARKLYTESSTVRADNRNPELWPTGARRYYQLTTAERESWRERARQELAAERIKNLHEVGARVTGGMFATLADEVSANVAKLAEQQRAVLNLVELAKSFRAVAVGLRRPTWSDNAALVELGMWSSALNEAALAVERSFGLDSAPTTGGLPPKRGV